MLLKVVGVVGGYVVGLKILIDWLKVRSWLFLFFILLIFGVVVFVLVLIFLM